MKENENTALKNKLERMNSLMNSYDVNIMKQSDEITQLQNDLLSFKEEKIALKTQIKELNESVANMNRDKVNLMREMTLINDKNIKLDREVIINF